MKTFDKISMCLRNLWRRKVRTLLTTFGVVIGTCAIVVMVSLGVGMNAAQQATLEEMGNLTLIRVYSGWDWEYQDAMSTKGVRLGEAPKLDFQMLQKIKQMEHVKSATPMVSVRSEFVLQAEDRYLHQGQVMGVDFDSMPGLGYVLDSGHWPTKAEYKNAVVVSKQTNYYFADTKRRRNNTVSPYPDEFGRIKAPLVDIRADRLFLNIGDNDDNSNVTMRRMGRGFAMSSREERLKIPAKNGKYPMRVVGTLFSEESGDSWNYDFDSRQTIYMDISRVDELRREYFKKTKTKDYNEGSYEQVYVMADSIDTVDQLVETLKTMGVSPSSSVADRKAQQKQTQTIQMVLGGLAGISLLVAALGITNTMVMSIYERTREIGIMKVLGCVVGNIRTMFLMEAGCIGLLGGVLGVGLSYGISFVLNAILNSSSGGNDNYLMGFMYGWNSGDGTQFSIIPPWLVAGAMAFAILIGLVSGFSPANRAVKISALEAIKHD